MSENKFSWSATRGRLFRSCQRAYYFNHYGSWLGWEPDASERVRKVYILKKMTNLVLWAGSVVHDTIKSVLINLQMTGNLLPLDDIKEQARQILRKGWLEAVNREWEKYPSKKFNLFELYYGNGRTLDKSVTDDLKTRIFDALEAFYFCDTLKQLQNIPGENWISVDELDTFEFDGQVIYCALDVAYRDSEGKIHIVDWKTGGENAQEISIQLGCYALYALDRLGVSSLDDIILTGVYLNKNGMHKDYSMDREKLNQIREVIGGSIQAMLSKLRNPEENSAEEEDFPCCGNSDTCEHCNFKEICPRD